MPWSLAGVNNATIDGIPPGTLLYETHTAEMPGENFFVNTWGDEAFARYSEVLGRLAGVPLVTAIGSDQFDGQPIIVGPENLEWRVQRLVWQALPVHEASTQFERTQLKNRLGGLRFHGMQFMPRPSNVHPFHADTTPVLAEYSIFGPLRETMRPLSNVRHFAADDKGENRYAIDLEGKLVSYHDDPEKQQAIPWPDGMGKDFRPGALAFDTKRARLLVAQSNAPHDL